MAPCEHHRAVSYGPDDPVPEAMRSAVAALEFQANPEGYAALGLAPDVQGAVAEGLLNLRMTETGNILIIVERDHPVALAAHFPTNELRRRQLATVLHLVRGVGGLHVDAAERLRQLQGAPHPTTADGGFVGRFAVAAGARGTGLAESLMNRVQTLYPERPLALHVRRTNTRALRFYIRIGFRQTGESSETLLLER